jgi:fermentation-respiration switch protein FrsA (DUF1100 family)
VRVARPTQTKRPDGGKWHRPDGRKRHRALAGALVTATLLAGCQQGTVDQASPLPAALPVPQAAKQSFGPYAVGVRTESFVDTSRSTDPNRGEPGQPARTLQTMVLYPAQGDPSDRDVPDAPPARDGAPFPLIEFSHGFTSNGPTYTLFLRRLAAAGYIVAAPTFPLSSRGAPGGPSAADYRNQPGDVTFVISEMLRVNRDPASLLRGLVDPDKVAVAGHSLGAITTLGVAYNSCCADRRIKAAVPISGIELPFPGGKFVYRPEAPLLLIHGDADATVPYTGSENAYRAATAPKFLLTLVKGPHSLFFGAGGEVIVKVMLDFFDHYLKGRAGSLDSIPQHGNVAGTTVLVSALT